MKDRTVFNSPGAGSGHGAIGLDLPPVPPGGLNLAEDPPFKHRESVDFGPRGDPYVLPASTDSRQFEAIFLRYSRPVLSFIYNLIGSRFSAEELTQETFIRAFVNLGSKNGDAKISTWLFGIAHNVVREAIRQKYRNRELVGMDQSDLLEMPDLRKLPEQNVISQDMVRKIQLALAVLSEDRRAVFLLKVVYDLSYEEISSITGFSVAKLKTDLHRAKQEMRRKLKPYIGDQVSGLRGDT